MKRITSVILCAFVACAAVSHSFADTATVNGITWTYTVSNGAASIAGPAFPISIIGAITIPSSLDVYPVRSIRWYTLTIGCILLAGFVRKEVVK